MSDEAEVKDHDRDETRDGEDPLLAHWNENETFATSEATSRVSDVELLKFKADTSLRLRHPCCSCSCSYVIQAALFICLYATPILFLLIPKLFAKSGSSFTTEYNITYMQQNDYSDIGTQGMIISLSLKTLILTLSSVVYLTEKTRLSKLPQINLYKVIVITLSYSVLFIFWIFYAFKVIHWDKWAYKPIIIFTSSYVEVLLFLHYFGIVMLYLRNKEVKYVLEVIRTTDGESRFYNCGAESIQTAGAYVLSKYYRDFPLYNPAQQHRSKSRLGNVNQSYKVYSIEESAENGQQGNGQRAILAAAARRRDAGQNERYYAEIEKERRVRKRRSRLEAAVEDAFTLVQRQRSSASSASDVASEVWPTMARSMQKYLRTTRQHEHYNQEDCLDHLSFCFRHNMSAAAFVSRYVNKRPSVAYPGHLMTNTLWSLASDQPLLTSIQHGSTFTLIQSNYSLVVSVRKHPTLILREEYQDPSSFRFVVDLTHAESPV